MNLDVIEFGKPHNPKSIHFLFKCNKLAKFVELIDVCYFFKPLTPFGIRSDLFGLRYTTTPR
ncbi:hypothetical protein Hdeb2414_s0003g00095281 [Helianthus debilis subsp. tardiflorus]